MAIFPLLYLITLSFFIFLQFFGLLPFNLPFFTSFRLLFLHCWHISYVLPHTNYICLIHLNYSNYVYLIIIMSSLHHIISSLLHIFHIVLQIYLRLITSSLLCLTVPQLFYNFSMFFQLIFYPKCLVMSHVLLHHKFRVTVYYNGIRGNCNFFSLLIYDNYDNEMC